jgi:diketogulonate reductase-like aldo/keto reductase
MSGIDLGLTLIDTAEMYREIIAEAVKGRRNDCFMVPKVLPENSNSPIEQGRLPRDRVLTAVAIRHRATTAQIALAWALRQPDIMVIPKATALEHVRENRAALDIRLTNQDLAELDHAFPPQNAHAPLSCCECDGFGTFTIGGGLTSTKEA